MCSSPSGGLFHAALEGFFFSGARFGGVFADVFGELHRASAFAQRRVAQICRAGFRACRLRSFPTSRTKADGLTRNPGTGKSPEPADRNVCPTSESAMVLLPRGGGLEAFEQTIGPRSEERRVGKECRSRGQIDH